MGLFDSAIDLGLNTVTGGLYGLATGNGYGGKTINSAIGGGLNIGKTLGTQNGFDAGMAPGTTDQLSGAQGTYNNNVQAQNNLLAALQGQANGTGPNPAQAMFNQSTNQNIDQNSGMIASQKGINPALATRQASMNAANMGQQAAGQAATMQAQQQVNAQNQMGNVAGQIGSQALNQQNIAQQGFYAPQSINAGVATGNAKNNAGLIGGLMGAGGAAFMAEGGMVDKPGYAEGGMIGNQELDPMSSATAFFNSQLNAPVDIWKMTSMNGGKSPGSEMGTMAGGAMDSSGMGGATSMPMMNTGATMMAAHGGMSMKQGGKVPGKAQVSGDSYANDTIDAKLSPHEIVIPRSITMGKNPGDMAKKFVEEQLAKHAEKGKNKFANGGESTIDTPETPQLNPEDTAFQGLKEQYGDKAYSPKFMADLEEKKNFNNALPPAPLLASNNASQTQGVPTMESDPMNPPPPSLERQSQMAQGPDTFGTNAQMGSLGQGVAEQKYGLMKEAAAEGAAGKQEAAIDNHAAQQQQVMMNTFQNNNDALMNDLKGASDAYQKQQIDPNHYWSSKDTPSKIGSVIGLLMGGLSSGLTGQENPAMKFLNAQIDRDIQSQSQNMDKQKNLMAYNFQKLGNLRDATAMTKAMQLDVVSNQLKAAAANSKDPIAQARALQEAGKIDQQIAPMIGQMSMRKTIMGGADGNGGGIDPSLKIKAMIPEAQQGAYYKELQDMQSTVKAKDNILGAFEQVAKLNTVGNRILSPIQSSRQIDAITGPLTAGLSKETAGRFTEQDAGMLAGLWPKAGDSEETIQRKKSQINHLVTEKMNFPMLKTLGINPESTGRYAQDSGQKKIQMGAPQF